MLRQREERVRGIDYVLAAALVAVVWLGLNPQITYHVREARMYPLMATTAALAAVAS